MLTQALKNLKNMHFNGLLLTKVYNASARKYREFMFDGTQDWQKDLKKTDLFFQKWQKFGEFWSEHSKVPKIWTSIGPFW